MARRKRPLVLVVDDDESMQDVVRVALEQVDVRLAAAPNLLLGITMARRDQPDLVILDALLPGSTPYEVVNSFAAVRDAGAAILLTSGLGHDAERLATSVGAYRYLHKPFDVPDLVAAVFDGINQQAGAGQRLEPAQGESH